MSSGHWDWTGNVVARHPLLALDRGTIYDRVERTRYSHRTLDAGPDRTAHLLACLGVGRGNRVAALSKNRIDRIDAYLGASKPGAVLVPLNAHLANVNWSTCREGLAQSVALRPAQGSEFDLPYSEVSGHDGPVMGEHDVRDHHVTRAVIRDQPASPPERPIISFDDPELVLFISDTTGVAKGAVLSHRLVS